MNKAYLVIILAFGLVSVTHASENDFDKICKIYTTVLKKNMNAEAGSDYINKNIKRQIHNKAALRAHNNIFIIPQTKRYKYFQKSAEHSIKSDWHCPAMKALLTHPPK